MAHSLYFFARSFRRAYKRRGLYPRGAFNRNRNSALKKAIAELIKVLYRCAIKLQTIIINPLHVNKIWNRIRGGHILGGGGRERRLIIG